MNYEPFYRISYGLYIIASALQEKKNGYIANTVFQVTADPPQLAVSCNKNNLTSIIISQSGAFSVSILHKDVDPKLFGTFGFRTGKDIDKFAGVAYEMGSTGAPIVTESTVAWLECRVTHTVDLGSHILFVGKVEAQALLDADSEPLTYEHYRKVKKGKAPKNAPTYVPQG